MLLRSPDEIYFLQKLYTARSVPWHLWIEIQLVGIFEEAAKLTKEGSQSSDRQGCTPTANLVEAHEQWKMFVLKFGPQSWSIG